MAKPKGIVSLAESADTINMLITAESGWGKTVFAGTADQRNAGGGKALFLVADPEGTLSAKYQGSSAEQLPIPDWDDLVEAYKWLREEGHKEYQWVIIDSVTEMQKIAMKKALEIAVRINASRDPDVPAIQDYQKVQNQVLNMIKQFNDLPCNVIYTALPMRVEDHEGEVYYLPSMQGGQGALAQQIMGYMSVAGFGTFKRVKNKDGQEVTVRRVYFQPTDVYRCKDRFDVLGSHKDNVTIPQIEKLIRSKSSPSLPAKKAASPRKPVRRVAK
jgi:hypothetical protein